MKKYTTFFLVLSLIFTMALINTTNASERASYLINTYSISLSPQGSGSLKVNAVVSTVPTVETLQIVYVDLYELASDGTWKWLTSSNNTAYNTTATTVSYMYSGKVGTTYKAVGYYYAKNGSIYEYKGPLTSTYVIAN